MALPRDRGRQRGQSSGRKHQNILISISNYLSMVKDLFVPAYELHAGTERSFTIDRPNKLLTLCKFYSGRNQFGWPRIWRPRHVRWFQNHRGRSETQPQRLRNPKYSLFINLHSVDMQFCDAFFMDGILTFCHYFIEVVYSYAVVFFPNKITLIVFLQGPL